MVGLSYEELDANALAPTRKQTEDEALDTGLEAQTDKFVGRSQVDEQDEGA